MKTKKITFKNNPSPSRNEGNVPLWVTPLSCCSWRKNEAFILSAEIAKAHPSLFIDLPKKTPDGKQALNEPDKSPDDGRDLEISHSSWNRSLFVVCQYKKKVVVRQKASSEIGMRERERKRGGWPGSRETSSKTNWLEDPYWITDTSVLTYLRLGDWRPRERTHCPGH